MEKRIAIKTLYEKSDEFGGKAVTVKGWARTVRDGKEFGFIDLNDGSSFKGVQIVFDGKVIAGTRAKKVRSKSYNAFSSIDFPSLAVIQDGNIMRYLPMLPYEDEVRFYEELDENIFLMKLIPGIKPQVLEAIFNSYDCIIVESFGVGGIPQSLAKDFYRLCQEHPEKIVIMATQVAHEGSDMTVYEVGHDMKKYCRFLESYDMTLESVRAKTMWMLGNIDLKEHDMEDVFYKNINYDVIFGKNRKDFFAEPFHAEARNPTYNVVDVLNAFFDFVYRIIIYFSRREVLFKLQMSACFSCIQYYFGIEMRPDKAHFMSVFENRESERRTHHTRADYSDFCHF